MSEKIYCVNCFGVKLKSTEFCPKCKYPQPGDMNPRYLKAPYRLHHQYVIGRVLGEGGFGITYLAYDRSLGIKVVVKEYFPLEFSSRNPNNKEIISMDGDKQQYFLSGKRKFITEARLLSTFRSPYIVSIRHFFEENNTAYFVMEYLQGKTFEQYIKDKGGKLSFEEVRPILLGILDGLEEVHSHKSYHRDIKPENIYMSGNQPLLLDFGSARQETAGAQKTTMSLLTPGFAPIEQYSASGIQGPWTDIYGLAATIYYAVAGELPPLPSDRLMGEAELKDLKEIGSDIRSKDQDWLFKGLELHWNKRPASVEEWRQLLPPPPSHEPEKSEEVSADENFIRFAILPKLTSRILTPEAEREIKESAGFLDITKEHAHELIEQALQMTGSERRDLKKEKEAAESKRKRLEAQFLDSTIKKVSMRNTSNLTFSEIFQPDTLIDKNGPLPEALLNSLGMEFVLITPYVLGKGLRVPKPFPMAQKGDVNCSATLTEQYYIQKHPITQAQWHKLMGRNPAYFTDKADSLPVEQISWDDCNEFVKRINRLKEGLYRLPTEAEWAFACRGNRDGLYSFGNFPQQLVNHSWFNKNANGSPQPVGKLEANPFKVHDMYGNVWEWVSDYYEELPESHFTNPKGPKEGFERVIRGGSWMSGEDNCTSFKRWKQPPTTQSFQIGARLMLELPPDRK